MRRSRRSLALLTAFAYSSFACVISDSNACRRLAYVRLLVRLKIPHVRVLTCVSSASGSGKDCIRYSICFAFRTRSVTSSVVFSVLRRIIHLVFDLSLDCKGRTSEHIRWVKLCLFLRHRYLRADLHEVDSRRQIRDALGHDVQQLGKASISPFRSDAGTSAHTCCISS